MSDNIDEEVPVSGMNRRDFVKRTAIVGGMVWAAPAISTLGGRAFASTEGTPRDCVDISYLAVVITVDGTTYQFKIDSNGTCENAGQTPKCESPNGWEERLSPNTGGCSLIGSRFLVDQTDPCCWSVTVAGNETFSLTGVAMGAGGDMSPSGQGFCASPTVSNGNRKYTFCSPATKNA